ncbi:DUF664 domain-containing protein [Streptomyces hygroscopicus]|nr:DUF664 domain-containing protein [Streptomyces hygroscopicus]
MTRCDRPAPWASVTGATSTSLRWILLHMIEETARHVGHMDTIRELIDGEKGYY